MIGGADDMFVPRLARRRRVGRFIAILCAAVSLVGIVVLAVLLVNVSIDGLPRVSRGFIENPPSQLFPERAGMNSAIMGTFWLIVITGIVSVTMGVGAAVYLHEFARDTWLTRLIRLNIANLAGVPSIVYGILGLAVFVRWLRLDRSVIAGALTLTLVILPVIIIATREALAGVPRTVRSAAFALGATRWQTVRAHVLPAATPGILTGVILALSRALGEAAPLIMIGALTYVKFAPDRLVDPFTAMPIQIFNWAAQPQQAFHFLSAAGIVVMLAVLLTMNAVAVGIRAWHQRHKVW